MYERMYHEVLQDLFEKHCLTDEARADIRHLFAIMIKDSHRLGYSEGWDEGQSLCDRTG